MLSSLYSPVLKVLECSPFPLAPLLPSLVALLSQKPAWLTPWLLRENEFLQGLQNVHHGAQNQKQGFCNSTCAPALRKPCQCRLLLFSNSACAPALRKLCQCLLLLFGITRLLFQPFALAVGMVPLSPLPPLQFDALYIRLLSPFIVIPTIFKQETIPGSPPYHQLHCIDRKMRLREGKIGAFGHTAWYWKIGPNTCPLSSRKRLFLFATLQTRRPVTCYLVTQISTGLKWCCLFHRGHMVLTFFFF